MKRISYLLGILAVAICATPAQAGNWMMVYADGQRPSRNAYYVEIESLRSRVNAADQLAFLEGKNPSPNPQKQVHVMRVLEDTKMPDRIGYTIDINCQSNQMKLSNVALFLRNSTTETLPDTDWHPIRQPWATQTAQFGCNEVAWRAALEKDMKNPNNPTELVKLGFLPMGEQVSSYDLADTTWQAFWRDGQRPAYTTTMTPEAIERLNQQVAQQIQAAKQQINGMIGIVEGELGEMQERDAIRQEIAQRRKDHPNTPAYRRMQGWLGLDEKLILQSWGTPANVYDTGKTRFISYNRGYQERWVIPTVDGGQIIENNFNCEITFELQRGEKLGYQVVDFKLAGNSCKNFRL